MPMIETSPFLSMDRVSIKPYLFSVEFENLGLYADGKDHPLQEGGTAEEKIRNNSYAMKIEGKTVLRYVPFFDSISILFPEKRTSAQHYFNGKPVLKTITESDRITIAFPGLPKLVGLDSLDFLDSFSWSFKKESKGLQILLGTSSQPWTTYETLGFHLGWKHQEEKKQRIQLSATTQGMLYHSQELPPFLSSLAERLDMEEKELAAIFLPPPAMVGDVRFKNDAEVSIRTEGKIIALVSAAMHCVGKGAASNHQDALGCDDIPGLLLGGSIEFEETQAFLGSHGSLNMELRAPISETEGKAELRLKIDSMISKELHALLPKVIPQNLPKDFPEKLRVLMTPETLASLLPDFPSMGNMALHVHLSADMARLHKGIPSGNAVIALSSKDHAIKAELDAADLANARATLILENSDALIDDLHGYAKRVVEHPALEGLMDPSMKAGFPKEAGMIKMLMAGFGEERKGANGKKAMVFEKPITKEDINDFFRAMRQ